MAEAMDTSPPFQAEITPLVEEFKAWELQATRNIQLKETAQDDEGKVSLMFIIENSQNFTLHCPLHYPNYVDDNFFVEADAGLQLWCNALNEYLLDTAGRLSLAAILNKGVSLYSSADQEAAVGVAGAEGGEEDEEMDEDVEYEEELFQDNVHGEDEQLDDILDNDLSWELEIARRKKKWKAKEMALRNERNNDASLAEEDKTLQQLYHDPTMKSRQPKQVFSSSAASGILTNDLVSIMESKETTGVEADTIDDNIFQWNVKIKNFSSNCALDKDFKGLNATCGYDFIELQLDFSMDLYPFFPPLVKVIRPRLQGSMMLRVTTMEILKLSYWNPARDMKSVLTDIKSFLQTWARLDLQSERNDRNRYPDGAYIDIEHHLLRLALVSEIVPRANKKYVVTSPPPKATLPPSAMEPTTSKEGTGGEKSKNSKETDTSAAPSEDSKKSLSKFFKFNNKGDKDKDKEEKKKQPIPAKLMAKGVGYSSYLQEGWDVKKYMEAQKEKDKQIELVLGKICHELKKLHGSHQLASRNLPDLINPIDGASGSSNDLPAVEVDSRVTNNSNSNRGSRRKREHSPDEAGGANSTAPIDPLSDLYAVLEGSALVPFLESKLQANSFLEICSHTNVYKCVVNIIREIASQPCLVSLLGPLPDQKNSLHSLLLALEAQAQVLLDKIGRASANGSVPKSGKSSEKLTEKTSDDKLARDFLSLSKEVTQALKQTGFLPDINGESSIGAMETSPPAASSSTDGANSSTTTADDHVEEQQATASAAAVSNTAMAVAEPGTSYQNRTKTRDEKASDLYKKYMKSLQFDSCQFSLNGSHAHAFSPSFQKAGTPSSQIIFRVAQELSSLSTSLPLDFSSSIFIRSDDDKATLLRAIITGPEDTPYTGGCFQFDIYFPPKYPHAAPQVNFRTTGGGIVRFNPNLYNCGKVCLSLLGTWEGAQGEQWNETSTILQVLISIQSLILCSEPYYNEPGFERLYGTPQGDAESNKYSEDVFRNNLKYAILGQIQNPPEGFEDVVKAHFFLKRHQLIREMEKKLDVYKSKEVKKQFLEVKRELMRLEQPPNLGGVALSKNAGL